MPIYRHDEVLYVLRHLGAKVSVVAGEFRGFDYPDMLEEIRASAPELQHVISLRCGELSGVLRFEDLVAGTGVPDPGLNAPGIGAIGGWGRVSSDGCLAGHGTRSASFWRRARMSAWTASGGWDPSTVNIHSRPA